jgi:hypothetical protein
LSGSLDTPNWELFVRTQYTDVRGDKMPEEKFFASLSEAAPRRSHRGENVTKTHKVEKVALDDDDEVFQQAIANPPVPSVPEMFVPSEPETAVKPQPNPWRYWPVIAGVGVLAVLILAAIVFSPTPPAPPVTPEVTEVPTPEATAAQTPDLDLQPASIELLDTWRQANGYVPLTADTTLTALAQRHLSYLISIPRDDLPATDLYVDEAGRDIQTVAAEAGYAAPENIEMFVEVRDGDFPLDDLLLQLEIEVTQLSMVFPVGQWA